MSATIGRAEAPALPGLRERQREARDEAILENAYALMDEHGYEAMTMDDLADRVGISKRTLYHHFASKEAIAVRAVLVLIASAEQQVRVIAAGQGALARLDAVLHWMISTKLSPPKGPLAHLKAQPTLMSVVRTNPAYRDAVRSYLEAVAQIVRQAQLEDHVDKNVDAAVFAQMVFGIIRGSDFDDILTRENCGVKELVEMLVSSLMNGIMSKTQSQSEENN